MICCALIEKLMGSETASAPLGILMELLPEKVTFCSVLAWISWMPAVWLMGKATVTAVMGKFEPPKTFEILIRICEASVDMYRVCRMVELTKTAPLWFCNLD